MSPEGAGGPGASSVARAQIAEDLGRQAIEEIRREILADPPLPHVVFDTLNVESDGVSPHIEAFHLADQLFHIAWLESDPTGYLTAKPENGHPSFRPVPTTPLDVSSDCWRKISDVLGEANRKIEPWTASRDRTNAIHLLASKASIRRPDLAQRIRKLCDSSARLAQLASQLLFAAQETRRDHAKPSNEESPASKADPDSVDRESDRQTSPLGPEAGVTRWQSTTPNVSQPPMQEGPAGDIFRSQSHGTAEQPMPKNYLRGRKEILGALELKNNNEKWGELVRLNDAHGGPIIRGGQGQKPTCEKQKLIDWWNKLEDILAQQQARERDKKATVDARHSYGRDGDVVPGIHGGIKKRRGSSK